ncbi:DNA polymerase LigD, polymerase domain-containing protein [Alicyclobacillus hesperidum URH17-3-68]|nr:DNA polymerase LigD, polymerase domain-containing protein [Alicyclobacillus hesperidum URH17-3-68]
MGGTLWRARRKKNVQPLILEAEAPVRITHPDKLLFVDPPVTKLAYLEYLVQMAPYLLSHLRDRRITLVRCPHGIAGHRFYQRHVPSGAPSYIPYREVEGGKREIVIEDVATLLFYANLGTIEFHAELHRLSDPRPRVLSFDLDPSDTSDFEKVRKTAFYVRDTLSELDLPSVVKTSGASGLQVFVPLLEPIAYEDSRRIVRFVARYVEGRWPHIATTARLIKERGDKVYVDAPQHGPTRTLIAPYSVRATPLATVSTPIHWSELEGGCRPQDFTIRNVPARVAQFGDLMTESVAPASAATIAKMLNSQR